VGILPKFKRLFLKINSQDSQLTIKKTKNKNILIKRRKLIIFLFLIAGFLTSFLFFKVSAKEDSFLFGQEIVIVDNGLEFKIKAVGKTSEEILKNAGISLNEKDLVFPLEPKEGEKIIISRSVPVNLDFFGKKEKIYTREKTVGEFLKENKIEIKENYVLNYNLDDKIFPEIEIEIKEKPKPKPKPVLVKKETSSNFTTNPPGSFNNYNSSLQQSNYPSQIGLASWYSYVPGNYCASLSFPIGSQLLVTNLANGKSVIVTVNDRGPFIAGRIIDLERNAFLQIGSLSGGVLRVKVERIR
jgi:hypothetical protein